MKNNGQWNVDKSWHIQKKLDILNKSWSSIIKNGLNFTRIHANVIFRNDITQEFHFRLMEFTFLQFGVKSNLPKLLQNYMYMAFMVFNVIWENEDVINVIDHEIIQVFAKDIVQQMLKNNMQVSKAKWHYNIFKMTS